MYHPSRGGVRGGRDQFKWDDVKVDKHRENYLGHSIKAPVGRWQKGKDLHWYTRDQKTLSSDMELAKEEIRKIKEEEEQAMREALGLAPKRSSRPQGNQLDKHEFSELIKRGSTAEDLGAGHAEAARVQGLGYSRAPNSWEESTSLPLESKDVSPMNENGAVPSPSDPPARSTKEEEPASKDERSQKKRRREERKHEKRDKHRSHDSDDKRKHRREKEKRRRDSD